MKQFTLYLSAIIFLLFGKIGNVSSRDTAYFSNNTINIALNR